MSKEMNIGKAIEVCKELIAENSNDLLNCWDSGEEAKQAIETVLADREKRCRNYNELVNKICNKIDYFDMRFENAKKRNDTEKADFYWDLIINFKKILED